MIAQVALTILLAGVLLYAWLEYSRSPAVALLAVGAALVGLYFVWVPQHATRIAEFAGVGRGVDLVLYIWVAISLILLLNLHLKLRAQLELITELARALTFVRADVSQLVPPSARSGVGVETSGGASSQREAGAAPGRP